MLAKKRERLRKNEGEGDNHEIKRVAAVSSALSLCGEKIHRGLRGCLGKKVLVAKEGGRAANTVFSLKKGRSPSEAVAGAEGRL